MLHFLEGVSQMSPKPVAERCLFVFARIEQNQALTAWANRPAVNRAHQKPNIHRIILHSISSERPITQGFLALLASQKAI
jgi:hypothetical protein